MKENIKNITQYLKENWIGHPTDLYYFFRENKIDWIKENVQDNIEALRILGYKLNKFNILEKE